MAGTSNYPGALDNFSAASPTNLGDDDSTGRNHGERHDDLEAAVEAVQGELGINPAGTATTVVARLDGLDSSKAPVANPTFTGVAEFPDGSASAPSITNDGDTNTGLFFPAADTVAVTTGGKEALRVSSSRKLLINQDASQSSTVAGLLQISGTTNAHTSLTRFTANSSPPSINMNKSRGTSHAVPGAVANGDKLGNISWRADDGTTFIEAARIAAFVDGAPGTNDMPGALSFYTTADGAAAVTERMRIDRNGLITGTGTSLGDWTSYTPAITNLTLGNGTVVGKYAQIGKIVHVRLLITLGSTSSVSGTYIGVDLPITQAGGYSTGVYPIGVASLFDASASDVWQGPILSGGVAAFRIYVSGSSGSYLQRTDISSSVPFTWAASDTITASLTYQAA